MTTAITTRTLTGPATAELLRVVGARLNLTVTVNPALATPRARLTGPEEAVNAVEVLDSGSRWELWEPNACDTTPGGSSASFTTPGGSSYIADVGPGATVIQAGTIHGNINMGDAQVYVSGRRVTGHAPDTASAPEEELTVEVEVPRHVALFLINDTGPTRVAGRAEVITFKSSTGPLNTGTVAELDAKTVSGNLTAANVHGAARLTTVSGDVDVTGEGNLAASTVSGDVAFTATGPTDLNVSTVSGNITTTHNGHPVSSRTRSISGIVAT